MERVEKPPYSGGFLAGATGFEPAIAGVTGRNVKPLHYAPMYVIDGRPIEDFLQNPI